MTLHSMFRFTTTAFLAGLLVVSLGSDDAMAKKKKKKKDDDAASAPAEITETGIAAFDETFMKVKGIHDQLTDSENRIKSAETNMLTAVGVATDAPLATALADFQSQASDFISFEMDGTTPKLGFKPEAPQNVQDGVNGINGALDDLKGVLADLEPLPNEVEGLVSSAQAMPAQVPSAVKEAGMGAKDIAPTSKKVKNNVSATTETPARVESTMSAATGLIKTVTDTFGGES